MKEVTKINHRPLVTYLINNGPLGEAAAIEILIIISLTIVSEIVGSLTRAIILVRAVRTELELEEKIFYKDCSLSSLKLNQTIK